MQASETHRREREKEKEEKKLFREKESIESIMND